MADGDYERRGIRDAELARFKRILADAKLAGKRQTSEKMPAKSQRHLPNDNSNIKE